MQCVQEAFDGLVHYVTYLLQYEEHCWLPLGVFLYFKLGHHKMLLCVLYHLLRQFIDS
jgi:hypothetical protein